MTEQNLHCGGCICGHTEQIAKEHYWTVSVGDLDIAMDKLSPKLATKLAQMPVSEGLESSLTVSDSEDQETKKAPIIQGFDDICRLMSSLGISIGVDDIGLEHFGQVVGNGGKCGDRGTNPTPLADFYRDSQQIVGAGINPTKKD
jgi:hypothetical protein